jgi:hypothetical protein
VFSKTVFSIAWSTFRMYSVMFLFKYQLCGDFSNTPNLSSRPREKIVRGKIRRSWRPNGCRNDSVRKHVVQKYHRHMRSMSRSAILLKVGFVNFSSFQLSNEGINNIVTVPLWVESLRENLGPTMRLCDITTKIPFFSSCSGDSKCMGIVCTPGTWVLTVVVPRGELSYLALLSSEKISVPYFNQCFFCGGDYPPPRLSQTQRLPVSRQK